MRELSTDLVVAQRGEGSVAGLAGGFAAAEGIGGRRSYFSRAETDAVKQISDSTGQPGGGIHRMHDHIGGSGYRTCGARGQRFGEHVRIAHAIELSDRRNLGETYLQHIEAFDVVGAGIFMKDARVGDDGVLAHRAVSRRLRLNGIPRSRKWSRG